MQISQITVEQMAEIIQEGECLVRLEYGAQTVFVLHAGGLDVIAIQSPIDGSAVVVGPCSEDAAVGGSIHDQARHLWA
ncbi:hypothetical protein ACWKW4_04690 [Hydrogenophaga borbori]